MLAVESLSLAYGESVVLSGIDLEVASGQVVRLMGRNGVGKTTLLRSIMGLMRPHQGKVRFLAADMTLWPSHRRARAGISYVPQGRQVFPFLTVHENLLMGLEAAPARHRSPESVEQMYDLFPALKLAPRKAAGTLSGGQQQQLALARALVRQPRLLLLDEPTEGIQPSIVREIADLLQSLRQQGQTTILLVEQFLDFALGVADYCYVMEKGSIVLEGATKDLEPGLVRDYLAV
jgi:urea transport system ATP-binding protein